MNPIAQNLVGCWFTTRKRFCFVDKKWIVTYFVSELDKKAFESLPWIIVTYTNSENMVWNLKNLLSWVQKLCMEYSPDGQIPYVSRVDAGTVELIKSFWIQVFSSAELVQYTDSCWWWVTWFKTHCNAIRALENSVEVWIKKILDDISLKWFAQEYDVQQAMMESFASNWMVTNHPLIVATNPNNSDPHYFPTASRTSPIYFNSLIMLDLWCKEKDNPNAIYWDITKMIYLWNDLPQEMLKVRRCVADARDTWIYFLKEQFAKWNKVQWWQVDKVVRDVIFAGWYWENFIHRTWHSIQYEDHANWVNIDNYELKDTRYIIPDCWFSIEPGVYLKDKFWVRSEINVYVDENYWVNIYWEIQQDLIHIK